MSNGLRGNKKIRGAIEEQKERSHRPKENGYLGDFCWVRRTLELAVQKGTEFQKKKNPLRRNRTRSVSID